MRPFTLFTISVAHGWSMCNVASMFSTAMRSGHWESDPAFGSRSGAGLMRCKYPCKFQVGAVAIAAALSSLYFKLVLELPYCRVQTEFLSMSRLVKIIQSYSNPFDLRTGVGSLILCRSTELNCLPPVCHGDCPWRYVSAACL